jgi:hypothetical protein
MVWREVEPPVWWRMGFMIRVFLLDDHEVVRRG